MSVVAASHAEPSTGAAPPVIRARPPRRWGRWLAALAVAVVVAALLHSLWTNPNLDRPVIGEYLFSELTLRGLAVTLYLTAVAMLIGIAGGIVLAVMRLSGNPVLVVTSSAFVWLFRGTPVLVQILFWGYLGALYPTLALGLPFTDVVLVEGQTSALIGATTAAILALGINEAAYASEIVRAGIVSVDRGQTEAAEALGMSRGLTLRRIVLPQAMRVIVPPMSNETITMLKTTSLVSVISGADLLTNLQDVYAQTFEVIPLLIVASIWYLAVTTVLTIAQTALERRYGRGQARTAARAWPRPRRRPLRVMGR